MPHRPPASALPPPATRALVSSAKPKSAPQRHQATNAREQSSWFVRADAPSRAPAANVSVRGSSRGAAQPATFVGQQRRARLPHRAQPLAPLCLGRVPQTLATVDGVRIRRWVSLPPPTSIRKRCEARLRAWMTSSSVTVATRKPNGLIVCAHATVEAPSRTPGHGRCERLCHCVTHSRECSRARPPAPTADRTEDRWQTQWPALCRPCRHL